MPLPERTIIDTSAFYALISATDAFHPQAKLAYERLVDWEWELWTTSYILVETSALVHHRLGFEPLKVFMETVLSSIIRVLWVEDTIHHEAWKRMAGRQGKGFSLVDWTTVVAAERLKASVFTFDRGFRQEGVLVFPRWK
jgi:predicted nucleic acid-binding protein